MTAKYPTLEGGVTHSSPSSSFTNKESKSFRNLQIDNTVTVIKIEAYKSQKGLTHCYNSQHFCHIGVNCKQSLLCLWYGCGQCFYENTEKQNSESVAIFCRYDLQDCESPHPAIYRGCNYAKQELQRRRNPRVTTQVSAGRTFFSKYTTPDRLFAAPISSIGSNYHNKNSNNLLKKIRIRISITPKVSQCMLKI
jgi:hypothetical protein